MTAVPWKRLAGAVAVAITAIAGTLGAVNFSEIWIASKAASDHMVSAGIEVVCFSSPIGATRRQFAVRWDEYQSFCQPYWNEEHGEDFSSGD